MLLVGWTGEGVLSTTPWDSGLRHCGDGARDNWWLEKLGDVGTLWAAIQHCVEAALLSAFSQSPGCAAAEPLPTCSEDDQPRYAWHRYRNEYRISPNYLSLLQKPIY